MSWLLDMFLSAVFSLLSLYSRWKDASTPRRHDDAKTVEHKALTRGLGISIATAGITGVLAFVLATLFNDVQGAGLYATLIVPFQQAVMLMVAGALTLSLLCSAYFSLSLCRLERSL
jgi:hypothetical protein